MSDQLRWLDQRIAMLKAQDADFERQGYTTNHHLRIPVHTRLTLCKDLRRSLIKGTVEADAYAWSRYLQPDDQHESEAS